MTFRSARGDTHSISLSFIPNVYLKVIFVGHFCEHTRCRCIRYRPDWGFWTGEYRTGKLVKIWGYRTSVSDWSKVEKVSDDQMSSTGLAEIKSNIWLSNIGLITQASGLGNYMPVANKSKGNTVSGAGNLCCQIRISTCTATISESVVSLLLTPVTGARRQQQSLLAQFVWMAATEKGKGWLINVADALTEPYISW